MIGLRAQAGLLFVEADSRFTFSGDPMYSCHLSMNGISVGWRFLYILLTLEALVPEAIVKFLSLAHGGVVSFRAHGDPATTTLDDVPWF